MSKTEYLTNEKGDRVAVVIPTKEYNKLRNEIDLHRRYNFNLNRDYTYTYPISLSIEDDTIPFSKDNWVKFSEAVLNYLFDKNKKIFKSTVLNNPYLSKYISATKFQYSSQIANGLYFNNKKSANEHIKFCREAVKAFGINSWFLETADYLIIND